LSVVVWGHAITVRGESRAYQERENILFVGYLASDPNNDALLYLLSEIMPKVWSKISGRLLIVGARPSEAVRALAANNPDQVTLAGFVDDLGPFYDQCRIFVAPHRYAAGIPLKVIEAMAHGIPCVISRLLAQQLDASDGLHVLVGDSTKELIEKCQALYEDPELWQRIQQGGLQFVRERNDPVLLTGMLRTYIENSRLERRHGESPDNSAVDRISTAELPVGRPGNNLRRKD
jgi:glycosyltransferase involved in cell wall biosynthesis